MRRLIAISYSFAMLLVASPALGETATSNDTSAATAVAAQSSDGRWEGIFNEDTRYYSWHGTVGEPHGANIPPFPALAFFSTTPSIKPVGFPPPTSPGSGSLVYTPFGFQINGRPNDDIKSEFLLRGAYFRATQTTFGLQGDAAGATDTSITEKMTYLGIAGVQPFVSLSINLPTGRAALFGTSALARMDSDLVELATFGEGLNVGPTLGVNVPLTETLLASFGLGYTWRGQFAREGATDPITHIQGVTMLAPGSPLTANATVAYRLGAFVVQASGSFATESETKLDGVPFTKAGDRYLASLAAAYTWDEFLTFSLNGTFAHSLKNKVAVEGVPGLVVEALNSNSNVVKIILDITAKKDRLEIGPTGSYMYRDQNAWSSTALQFLPAKTRWSAGGTAGYALTDTVSLNARVEHIWITENANPDKVITVPTNGGAPSFDTLVIGSGIPEISSSGWFVSLATTAHF
jgi:hypothetical protein